MRLRRNHIIYEPQVTRDLRQPWRPHRQKPLRMPFPRILGENPPHARHRGKQRLHNLEKRAAQGHLPDPLAQGWRHSRNGGNLNGRPRGDAPLYPLTPQDSNPSTFPQKDKFNFSLSGNSIDY